MWKLIAECRFYDKDVAKETDAKADRSPSFLSYWCAQFLPSGKTWVVLLGNVGIALHIFQMRRNMCIFMFSLELSRFSGTVTLEISPLSPSARTQGIGTQAPRGTVVENETDIDEYKSPSISGSHPAPASLAPGSQVQEKPAPPPIQEHPLMLPAVYFLPSESILDLLLLLMKQMTSLRILLKFLEFLHYESPAIATIPSNSLRWASHQGRFSLGT